MTNIYRKIFYCCLIFIDIVLFILAVILGITIKNKIPCVVLSFLTLYAINSTLALWISTSNVRMVYSKLAWLLSFLVFPIISNIVYFIWGRMPYYKNTISLYKEKHREYLNLITTKKSDFQKNDAFDIIAEYAYNTRNSPVFLDSEIQVIDDNIDFAEKVINLIDSAQKTIVMNYYIIDNGYLFRLVKNKILKKANDGIKIYLLYDRYGSTNKFTVEMVASLAQNTNVYVRKFESDRDVWTRSANNFRSHKKMLIIDNKIALYGGSNLSDEYLSIRKNSTNWNDLNFIIKGEIIKSFLVDFAIDWDYNSFSPYTWKMGNYFECYKPLKFLCWLKFKLLTKKKQQLYYKMFINNKNNEKIINVFKKFKYFDQTNYVNDPTQENKAFFFPTGPRYYNNIVNDVLTTAIFNAKKSVKIISPYLQFNDSLISALISAVNRNVSIEIIAPGNCDDKWFLLDMNRLNYQQLLDYRINIYEYLGFIHSKLIIIDDEYIITGTFNLDFRSFTSNFESLLIIKNKKTLFQCLEYWNQTLTLSKEFNKFHFYQTKGFRNIIVQTGLQIIQPLL